MERVLVIITHLLRTFEAYWGIFELDKNGMIWYGIVWYGQRQRDFLFCSADQVTNPQKTQTQWIHPIPLDSPGHIAWLTARDFRQERWNLSVCFNIRLRLLGQDNCASSFQICIPLCWLKVEKAVCAVTGWCGSVAVTAYFSSEMFQTYANV